MQVQATTQTNPISTIGVQGKSPAESLHVTGSNSVSRVNARESAASANDVEGATKKLQDFVASVRGDIQFSTDQDSGETVVKVIDKNTKDVIMQLPSKEALAIANALDKFQGLLVKQQA